MTREERDALADELSNRKLKFADVVNNQYEMLSEVEMDCIVALLRQPDLTTALREAGNAKLEEAALMIEAGRDHMRSKAGGANARALADLTTGLAARIRSLISKKD